MLTRRKIWLERVANWGTGLAVPLVVIVGFRLLAHARDPAQPTPSDAATTAAAVPGRVLAPPIDASAPPVVTLVPPTGAPEPARRTTASDGEARCAALARQIREADAEASRARGTELARLREQGRVSRSEAASLHCPQRP